VLAAQEWDTDKESWPLWSEMPSIECIVVTGIDESSKVVDTINTGMPRTLADVIFRDSQYFADASSSDRRKIAKVAEHAIRMLGHRLASFADAFAPNRTHSECIEFLQRHPKLLDCVQFVYDAETDQGSVSNVVPLGTAAALMYLMGSSATTSTEYSSAEQPCERMLDWSAWDKACEFWEAVGNSASSLFPIKEQLSAIAQDADSISRAERMGVVVKAWGGFSNGLALTADMLALTYTADGEGVRHLSETPLISVVDLGAPQNRELTVPPVEKPVVPKVVKVKTKKPGSPIDIGDTVWVLEDPVEASWSGQLTQLAGKNAKVLVGPGFANKGKQVAVRVVQLQHNKPDC
jgi:hypothetical protein